MALMDGRALRVVALLTLSIGGTAMVPAPERIQKAGAQAQVTFVDEEAPPRTLRQLFEESTVVVLGTVLSKGATEAAGGGPSAIRRQLVRPSEVFRETVNGAVTPGSVFWLAQYGGTIEYEGRLVTTKAPSVPLDANDKVILFLTWTPIFRAYMPMYRSAFVVRPDGSMDIPSITRLMVDFFKRPAIPTAADLLQALRRLSARQ